MRFLPTANSTAAGRFDIESSENGTTVAAQSGKATSTITVVPVGDTPQVANATTMEDTLSSGITINRHANNHCTAIDALIIINHLNGGDANGEGSPEAWALRALQIWDESNRRAKSRDNSETPRSDLAILKLKALAPALPGANSSRTNATWTWAMGGEPSKRRSQVGIRHASDWDAILDEIARDHLDETARSPPPPRCLRP